MPYTKDQKKLAMAMFSTRVIGVNGKLTHAMSQDANGSRTVPRNHKSELAKILRADMISNYQHIHGRRTTPIFVRVENRDGRMAERLRKKLAARKAKKNEKKTE